MNKRTDEELCNWLRNNSSGCYRPCDMAAHRIEELLAFIAILDYKYDVLDMDDVCSRPFTQRRCEGCKCI